MMMPTELLQWIERSLDSVAFGEVGIIFHLRNGRIEWTEKIRRETERSVDRSRHSDVDSG